MPDAVTATLLVSSGALFVGAMGAGAAEIIATDPLGDEAGYDRVAYGLATLGLLLIAPVLLFTP
jgi:uncharacterized membrane protein YuzA (DUF378 family)